MRPTRATTRATGALALAAVVVALATAPAQAAAYRYWTYWQAPGGAAAWAFATQGPATAIPADGAVEGWSFGVTTESGSLEDAPAISPDFEALCGGTAPEAGRKRVALIVDTGPPAVAPPGQAPPATVSTCVVAAEDATGYEILRSVADVRVENGLVCGIAGYPADECAPVLDDSEAEAMLSAISRGDTTPTAVAAEASGGPDAATATSPDPSAPVDTGGPGTPLATLAVGLLLIGGTALWYLRGRRGR